MTGHNANPCEITTCSLDATARGARLFCVRHWRRLPADLRERIKWARTEDDEMELLAALSAANDELG